jgi:hypothetical protein
MMRRSKLSFLVHSYLKTEETIYEHADLKNIKKKLQEIAHFR